MRGRFITLEGIDGAGKSTHHAWLVGLLRERGIEAVATREPGGTPLGEKLRTLLLSEPMHLETETLLMFAARREHLHSLILPTLDAGKWVVSDRFTDATYAYQGGGRGVAGDRIALLEEWVHPGFRPDLTFLFDLPVEMACQRLAAAGHAADRFEQETLAFFKRVRAAYLERAAADPSRIRVVDATKSIQEIRKLLQQLISTIC